MEPDPIFRVSSRYLWNLGQQALFGSLGLLTGWLIFVIISLWLCQTIPLDLLIRLPALCLDLVNAPIDLNSEVCRELLRFGMGPVLLLCVIPGWLGDVSSWIAVRYEFLPDRLRMRWRRLTREIPWDLISVVDERSHAVEAHRSLRITQNGAGPILVRGLDQMSEFIAQLRLRLPRLTKWNTVAPRVDLTGRATNFVIGLLLPVPLYVNWIVFYVLHLQFIELGWALVLLAIAVFIWMRRPMSRSHMCVREVELCMAALLVLLSGLLTFTCWFASPVAVTAAIQRWLP